MVPIWEFFFYFLDLVVHNSFILFSVLGEGKKVTLKHFYLVVASALIEITNQSPEDQKSNKK